MSFLKTYWYIPSVLVLCIIVGVFLMYDNRTPGKPKVIYVMPEKTGRVKVNTGRPATPMATGLPKSESKNQVESNVEYTERSTVTEPVEQAKQVAPEVLATNGTDESASDDTISDEELQRQLEFAARAEAYLEGETAELQALFAESWDLQAQELRPMSIPERREYLANYRADLEKDADEDDTPELLDEVVDMFVRAMNERGVYFE